MINKEVEKFKTDQQVAVKQWAQQLKERLQTQHQKEIQSREAALAEIGNVAEGLAQLAVAGTTALANQQRVLARAQTTFAVVYPAYVPANQITITNCQWIGRLWTCTQNSL